MYFYILFYFLKCFYPKKCAISRECGMWGCTERFEVFPYLHLEALAFPDTLYDEEIMYNILLPKTCSLVL